MTGDANQISSQLQTATLDTRIGKLEFTRSFADGDPTDATVKKLFNELDFQRAAQAYIWSIPFFGMAQWQHSHEHEIGAKNGQSVFLGSYQYKIGGVTYKDGDWLDGGTSYALHVPANAPAEAFWSVTAYEVSTRTPDQQQRRDCGPLIAHGPHHQPGQLGGHRLRSR